MEQQTKEVLVILEKSLSNTNIKKLRQILLLEADFNTFYKIIFKMRLVLKLEESQSILGEIIGG